MVKGIEKFREAFKDFTDNYVIIGGTACDIILEDSDDVEPRATENIDMILIVEKVTSDFGRHFWQFIEEGEYSNRKRKRGEGKDPVPELYRFIRPKSGYPVQTHYWEDAIVHIKIKFNSILFAIFARFAYICAIKIYHDDTRD